MRRFLIGLACAAAGYLVSVLLGYFLIMQLSSNQHDRSLEASMTSAFVFGPAGAILAFILGLVFGGKK